VNSGLLVSCSTFCLGPTCFGCDALIRCAGGIEIRFPLLAWFASCLGHEDKNVHAGKFLYPMKERATRAQHNHAFRVPLAILHPNPMRCFFLRNNLLPWFEANAMADANIISQETGNTKPSLSLSGCYVLCTSLSVNRLRRMANHRDDQYGQETRQTAAGIYQGGSRKPSQACAL
jgi:hypothetical protein